MNCLQCGRPHEKRARRRSETQKRRDARPKLIALTDDRAARADQWGWLTVPPRLRTVEKIDIPVRAMALGDLSCEPVADRLLLVPEVDDARVSQAGAVPALPTIAGQHVEPDRVDPQ